MMMTDTARLQLSESLQRSTISESEDSSQLSMHHDIETDIEASVFSAHQETSTAVKLRRTVVALLVVVGIAVPVATFITHSSGLYFFCLGDQSDLALCHHSPF